MGKRAAGILPIAPTGRILWNQRSYNASHPNTWALWGGGAEEDESPIDTAVREFREESSYRGHIRLYPLHTHCITGVLYHAFAGFVENEFDPEIDHESNGYIWLELPKIFKIFKDVHPGTQELLHDVYPELKAFCYQ